VICVVFSVVTVLLAGRLAGTELLQERLSAVVGDLELPAATKITVVDWLPSGASTAPFEKHQVRSSSSRAKSRKVWNQKRRFASQLASPHAINVEDRLC